MKKLFIVMAAMTCLAACEKKEPDTLHLICRTSLSETDPTVKEQYDVTVKFLDDGAILIVDGVEYALEQGYDARVEYYRFDPWYNFQIGNRQFGKYALGIPSNEGFARYTQCEEK
ncbi:MAG: hypothetical protein K2L25_02265 [Alphaproteobacteria bacterium]|nr:hypothetical protein [Alphaproteobacteria bacterium]